MNRTVLVACILSVALLVSLQVVQHNNKQSRSSSAAELNLDKLDQTPSGLGADPKVRKVESIQWSECERGEFTGSKYLKVIEMKIEGTFMKNTEIKVSATVEVLQDFTQHYTKYQIGLGFLSSLYSGTADVVLPMKKTPRYTRETSLTLPIGPVSGTYKVKAILLDQNKAPLQCIMISANLK